MKKILYIISLLIILVVGIIGINTFVDASGGTVDWNQLSNNAQNVNNSNSYNNVPSTNVNTNTNVNNNTNIFNNTNTNPIYNSVNTVNNSLPVANNTANDIPDTGIVEDTAFVLGIIAFGALAIYAYKRTRDYRF